MVAKLVFVPFVLAAGTGTPAATWAQLPPTEETKLIAGDSEDSDRFGSSVCLSGDTAVIGAPTESNAGGVEAGSAYVFVCSGTTWTEQAKLIASDAALLDFFGSSVSVSGDTAVVGSPSDDHSGGTGSAYVFIRSGTSWTEQAKLTASDPEDNQGFGTSVSIWGDTAIVGADKDDNAGGSNAGSAYVFVRSGTSWTEQAKLTASDAELGDTFGTSVSISGDTAVVGALDDVIGVQDAGSAYVFVRSGTSWTEQAKLTASDPGFLDSFGGSVSVSGDTVAIGSQRGSAGGELGNAGCAYVFVRTGTSWTEQAKLTASDAAASDFFGYSVSISGDTAIVGADRDDHSGGMDAGSAYVFLRSGTSWTEVAKLTASDAAANDNFGGFVSLSEGVVVAGAPLDDHMGGSNAGSAYVFRFSPPATSYCTAGTSASGCQARLSATGTASATAPSGFTLSAQTVEGQKDGLFFFGDNGQQANPWGNSSSFQCVVPPVIRTNLLIGTGTIGLCDGALSLDMNAVWTNQPAKNPGAGAVVQAQLWYRDPFNTANNQKTSLSDAIEFVVAP